LHFPKPQNAGEQPQTNFLTKICDKTSIKKTCFSLCFQGKLLEGLSQRWKNKLPASREISHRKTKKQKRGDEVYSTHMEERE
jgi:hypothetical protein